MAETERDEVSDVVSPPRAFSVEGIDVNRGLFSLSYLTKDPTVSFVRSTATTMGSLARATWTPEGPGTIFLRWLGSRASVCAFGPGAHWLDAHAEDWCGVHDDVTLFAPQDPVVKRLHTRFSGMRMTSTKTPWHDIAWTIVQQMVRTRDAGEQWRAMVHAWGDPAPGPFDLRLPPHPARVANAPYFDFHPFGIEKKRADALRAAAKAVDVIERAALGSPVDARIALERIPGIGPWTSTNFSAMTLGDPDAVILGDYHLGRQVTFAFTGVDGGDDASMLALLEPFAGQRGRVVRLVMAGGKKPERRGPRRPQNDIRRG